MQCDDGNWVIELLRSITDLKNEAAAQLMTVRLIHSLLSLNGAPPTKLYFAASIVPAFFDRISSFVMPALEDVRSQEVNLCESMWTCYELCNVLRTMHRAPPWTSSINGAIAACLANANSVQTGNPENAVAQSVVIAALMVIGGESDELWVGRTISNEIFGSGIVTQVDSNSVVMNCRGQRREMTWPSVGHVTTPVALQPFDFSAALHSEKFTKSLIKLVRLATTRLFQSSQTPLFDSALLCAFGKLVCTTVVQKLVTEADVGLLSDIANTAIKLIPLRTEFKLQDVRKIAFGCAMRAMYGKSACSVVTAPFHEVPFEKVELSSSHAETTALTSSDMAEYWTSAGAAGQHWIRLLMKPGVCCQQCIIYHVSSLIL